MKIMNMVMLIMYLSLITITGIMIIYGYLLTYMDLVIWVYYALTIVIILAHAPMLDRYDKYVNMIRLQHVMSHTVLSVCIFVLLLMANDADLLSSLISNTMTFIMSFI